MDVLAYGAAVTLCGSLGYLFYTGFLDRKENFKVEKIKDGAKHMEEILQRNIDKIILNNKRSAKHMMNIQKMLQESSLRPFGREISLYVFLLISAVFTIVAFIQANLILKNMAAAALIGIAAAILPHELLKLEVGSNRRRLRKSLPNFFLVISQLLEATPDIIDVIDTAVPKLKNPLKAPFKKFIQDYRGGRDLTEAINDLKSRYDNVTLTRFIQDIEDTLEQGGDFNSAIMAYIEDAYDNERNYIERITENTGNITGLLMIFGMFLAIVFTLRSSKPDFIEILLYNPVGKMTVNIIIILIIASIYIIRKSVAFKDE